MSDSDRLARFLRVKLRGAGRQYERARSEFRTARSQAAADLPTDDQGNARIVCRRYAERRAVAVDEQLRPACFEAGHPDCEGCVEDIRSEQVETW
jgi:hypothetical protein